MERLFKTQSIKYQKQLNTLSNSRYKEWITFETEDDYDTVEGRHGHPNYLSLGLDYLPTKSLFRLTWGFNTNFNIYTSSELNPFKFENYKELTEEGIIYIFDWTIPQLHDYRVKEDIDKIQHKFQDEYVSNIRFKLSSNPLILIGYVEGMFPDQK